MAYKQLFRKTATLLRTALLLGAMILVNTQTQAQNAEQLAAMPNAFETINPVSPSIIDNGEYYYIQFYDNDRNICSYLTDRGVDKRASITDFLPSNNRLWTLVDAGDSHFKLKSKEGHYIGFARIDGATGNRYVCLEDANDTRIATFSLQTWGDGYYLWDANNLDDKGNKGLLGRTGDEVEWSEQLSIQRNDNSGKNRSRMHFVQLKSNVAYIIYYRGEGTENTNPNVETTRHYLTYSGADAISNGSLEGNDNSSFFVVEQGGSGRQNATISDGVGKNGRGIVVHSADNPSNIWDTQFFIRANRMMSPGTTVHLEFDYKASQDATVSTQGHGEPQSYVNEDGGGNIDFTTEWQHLSRDFAITGNVQTIAFNLAHLGSATDYYFDNITFNITSDVSSRQSIIPKDKPLRTLPTLAAYHQDGLWTLEETGNGDFYIKKYGEEQYLTVEQINTYDYRTVLGNKDYVHGRFNLEDPNANRYTRVHNNTATNIWGLARYLTYNNGDGSPVIQSTDDRSDYWNASFYPVEVPVPNKDEFFQVLVKWGNNMIDHNGGVSALPANESDYDLWQLEMIDDYGHFRLKAPNGRYLKPGGSGVTEPNNPEGAEIMSNAKFFLDDGNDFSLTWYFVNPVDKEIPVNYYVTHRESYLKQYAEEYSTLDLDKQGLATEADSEWKDWNDNLGGFTQKVNHFEITHYVKRNNSLVVEFPTVLNASNDHVLYQRFYNYDEIDTEMDLDNLKAHVSLDTRDDGNVQYFLYKNGMVTGKNLDWNGMDDGGYRRYALRRFNFTNSDGNPFTVAVDVSRYGDLKYANETNHLEGDLEEPSLTMRYIYYMKDAKEMAAKLTEKTEGNTSNEPWLETKVFHFPAKQIAYEKKKEVGYRGEFLGLRHVFSDYWVFDGQGTGDDNLVSAVNDNNGGKIEVVIDDPNSTGIRLGGWNPTLAAAHGGTLKFVDDVDTYDAEIEADFKGFYFYDKMSGHNDNVGKTQYGDSRFVVFRYPASGKVTNTGKEVYVNVYLKNNGTRYQLAQYTIIFDENSETIPWISNDAGTTYPADGFVKRSARDPQQLLKKAGRPIAKVTFDYPANSKYYFPEGVESVQGWRTGGSIDGCSPIPLTFAKTNYSFSGFECNWGSYAMVSSMTTNYGNKQNATPADDDTHGYGDADDKRLQADKGFQKSFLYIDASEQPGDICSAPFVGDFCANDKLMVSGWISGSNKMGGGDHRCPGGITMTIKGEHMVDGELKTEILYRFCPGQCYELDDGPNAPDGSGLDGEQWLKNSNGQYIDQNGNVVDEEHRVENPNYDNNKFNVIWQQFYFEFTVPEKYDRHWIEVNNNCVSSQGGDFMLDNVEVYAIVPEVEPDMNTPYCLEQDGKVDMRLLKLTVDFDKQKSYSNVSDNATAELGFVFLKKDVFLQTLKENLGAAVLADHGLAENITLDELAEAIREGVLRDIEGSNAAYIAAFDAALLGNKAIWKSTASSTNMGAGVMYFQWNSHYESMEEYSFAKAVNKTHSTYRYTDEEGERYIVMNGNYPQLPWQPSIDYYIVPSNEVVSSFGVNVYSAFNICSDCSKASVFRIEPPYTLLGLGASDEANDYMVCEGQIPTLVTDLKGYDFNGVEVPMNDINYDWWLGDKANGVLPTLDNFHAQAKGGIKLDVALSTLRIYYPAVTSLDGIVGHPATETEPELTPAMVNYLKELVDAGQLILHQKSISVPATPAAADDPYFYLVACPIHDEQFDQALNPAANEYVAFYCDEPQGLRVKVGEKAPTLKTGFVPGENGFDSYNYDGAGDAILSIRLAKKEQFETVKHGDPDAAAIDDPANAATDLHFLWLPIRNAVVQSQGSNMVLQKSEDENIYLASTNDPVWDKEIYKGMKDGSLPIVGKISQLTAIDVNKNGGTENDNNRLCVYFTENFDVREGYSYTLSLPFQESPGENTCDGTILINLKIVPDYEVWTGAAGNTDWNNDENWRRADGNLGTSTEEPQNGAGKNNNELYRTNDLPASSPLKEYVTNYSNYRTAKDRLIRKGFAPLYCTHVLIKSNEWGDAPQLYDALDGQANLVASPFPNLRDTSTPILKFDMQARHFDLWEETYGTASNKGRAGDLIAEMYQVNSCDEIAFQPGSEMLNAHLLNYNNAWVEYQLDNKRWYLLGSPLQGTISGEWYAPKKTAQQKTTYYEPVTFNANDYDRYNPAIYQRSWDKAKAVLYEVGADYSTSDNPDDLVDGGSASQGTWSGSNWNTDGADAYLDRLGYKPMGGKKANVAIKGLWSNTYNDATVDYAKGGFSVMVMNHLKGENNDQSDNVTVVRLPKEDLIYKYWTFDQDVSGTDTDLGTVLSALSRAKNRGRLKTDQLLPVIGEGLQPYQKIQRTETTASRYGDMRTYTRVPTRVGENALPMTLRSFTEEVSAGISNLGYYLVENPFVAGLDMEKFFAANTGLEKKYWLLTTDGQHLVQYADGQWVSPNGSQFTAANAKVAPGQGFFVQATEAGEAITITFTADMQAQTRYGEPDAGEEFEIVVGTKQVMESVQALDEEGNGLVDENGNAIMVEVPKVDDQGNYEVEDIKETVTIYKYRQKTGDGYEFPLRTRGEDSSLYTLHSSLPSGLVITAKRDNSESSALVMQRSNASNDFLPEEDTETFINSDLVNAPTVYTLCGRLATTINSIHDFTCLPVGVESTSDAPCTLTFQGVEMLGDSVAFYDAVEKKLTKLESGMTVSVSGQTQNRYYLVRSLIQEEAAAETHLQIFTEGLKAKVIASTAEPITVVRCFDMAGQLLYTASPQSAEHSFTLPHAGVYIIEAQTENDRKTMKVIVK